MELPFNAVTVDERRMSVEDFMRLSLVTRVRYLLERRLRFYQDGEEIPVAVGLAALRHKQESG
jgi:hypothetical protein